MDVTTFEAFLAGFVARVQEVIENAKVTYNPTLAPNDNFSRAIKALARERGKPVVILIDEYDAPVGAALNDIEKATAIRAKLSAFYGEIKNNVGNIRFMMMTGVTKFTQLSVFSALNNLTDLTLQPEAATLLGYTEEELEANFSKSMHRHAEVMGLSYEDYRGQLRWWYNGYRFSPDCEVKVYNPLAIGRTLLRRKTYFEPTWSETGHSTALMKYLATHPLTARDYECIPKVTRAVFDVYDLGNINEQTFLYQGGYLTIKDFSPIRGFTLGIPNEDVRQDFNQILVDQALKGDNDTGWNNARVALLEYDFPTFFTCLKSFYARLTYGAKEEHVNEASYQRSLFILLTAGGLRVVSEDTQAQGRADLVADAFGRVFIFELKVSSSSRSAARPKRPSRKFATAATTCPISPLLRPSTASAWSSTPRPINSSTPPSNLFADGLHAARHPQRHKEPQRAQSIARTGTADSADFEQIRGRLPPAGL